ncbi:MAG: exosortase/archaeosortase family protein [Planctomycetota bacterium]
MDDNQGVPRPARLTDLVTDSPSVEAGESFDWPVLAKMGVVVVSLVALNWRQFIYLWDDLRDPDWMHGWMIALFSVFLVYSRFGEIASVQRKPNWWGLPVLVLAATMQVVAYAVRNPWSCQVTMIFLAAALVLFLAGWEMFKLAWLPILFLVFAMPIPDYVYSKIALPLQNFAALGSSELLALVGVDISSSRSALWVTSRSGVEHTLTVAEACSGMRLLLAFVALSVAMAYLTDRPVWQRVVLVGMGVPVAIICNVLRVIITALMYVIDRPQLGDEFMHEFTGMLMLVPAALILMGFSGLMRHLFVEVDEGATEAAGGPT